MREKIFLNIFNAYKNICNKLVAFTCRLAGHQIEGEL